MIIYRSNQEILSIRPNDSDKCTKKLMGENTLSLTVDRPTPFDFRIGDYVMFNGEKYTLNIMPKVKKDGGRFTYNLTLEGIEYELRKVQMLFYTTNLVYAGGADFSLMGDAQLQARVVVENLNRVQDGWTLGEVAATSAKNLTYSNNNCLEAINRIAQEFDTEFWIGSDKTINIGKRGDILAVNFEYGKNKGLYSIERVNVDSKDIVTRLYPFGSDQNLPKGYRNNVKRLQIEGDYIENNVELYGLIESSETFDDIKPERVGVVTGVEVNLLKFSDSSMNFDLNETDGEGNTIYLIPGTTAKIHFQTGNLAGYEFELSAYDHTTKTFTLKLFTDEVAYELPNITLKPAVGDEYVILDIYMPQSYVDSAEARLLAKAQESLAQNSVPNVAYSVTADPLFIKKLGFTFKPGDYVHITDSDIGIDRDIRMIGIERNLVNLNSYKFDLADTVEPSLTAQIITTLQQQDQVIRMNRLTDPARARRNYKVVQELQNAIFDQDGYFDNSNIKPFSIETNMLSVGSKGQQFYTDCMFNTNYMGNKNSIVVGNGILSHFTIEDEIRSWTITGLSETLPDDNLRYIYVKCLKSGNTGQVILSINQLEINEGAYYNFFAGVLSSVIDNARQVSLLFGFTTINGRFIKTGRIQSADNQTYFDLDAGVISGKITFSAGSSGYANITDKPDLSVYALNDYVDQVTSDLQDQIDGNITTWFYAYAPTLSNAPANGWTSDADKDNHLGDLFYDTATGYAYRFQKAGGVYSWQKLSDSDITAAMEAAHLAQDTADGKRRVFVAQPTNADVYDVGDLWANATYTPTYNNDLLKCKTSKQAGASFSITHWEKASKYTDDTAVNELEIGGRNLLIGTWQDGKNYGINGVTYVFPFGFKTLSELGVNVGETITGSSIVTAITGVSTYRTEFAFSADGNVTYVYGAITDVGKKSIVTASIPAGTTEIAFFYSFTSTTGTLTCKLLKLEKGNKPTDWTPAPEDIDAQLVVLNAKTAGRTVIEGGVVESELIMLGNGGISGMSGIPVDTNNNPLPSRWAGGTYQEAIDKIANIIEWFNGDAKFGDLWIDTAGSIAIKDTSGVIKVLLTKNNITTLAAIAGSTQNSTINNAANNNTIEGTTTVLLANSIVVNNNNSTVTVSCVISSSIIRDDKLMKCNGIADVSIYLYNTTTGNNVYIAKLHVVAADVYSASDSLNVGVAVTMSAGTYKLKIIYSHDSYSNCIFNSSISVSTTTVVFNGAVQRLEIGKNGIGIIGDSNNYSWMGLDGGVYKSVEKVESGGVYDKPGVLASATVASTGSSSNKWGGRVGNSRRSSTGVYVISHTIGHESYNIVACANEHDRHVIYTSKGTTSVTINVKNGSGTLVDQQFDYIIVGNNQ